MSDVSMEFLVMIIGSVVVVGLVVLLFMSFSTPFLDFLIDYENVKSFNKFTFGISAACTSGTKTITYVKFYSTDPPENTYAVALVGPIFRTFIREMSVDTKDSPHTTTYSQDRIDKCTGDYCYCLLKIQLVKKSNNKFEHCINPDATLFLINREDYVNSEGEVDSTKLGNQITDIVNWQNNLKDELNHNYVKEVKVIQCKKLMDELRCKYEHGKTENLPIFVSVSGLDKIAVWMDNVRVKEIAGCKLYRLPLFFDSISLHRTAKTDSSGETFYDFYVNMYSNPDMTHKDYDKDIIKSDCDVI